MPRDGSTPDFPADQLGEELIYKNIEQQPSDPQLVRAAILELLTGLPDADLEKRAAIPASKKLADTAAQLPADIRALPESLFKVDNAFAADLAARAFGAIAELKFRQARTAIESLFELQIDQETVH